MSSSESSERSRKRGSSRTVSEVDGPLAEALYTGTAGLLTVALLWPVAFRGWIPHDEGTLGQAATRILEGQWPHVDFLDVYPGLLGFIHAGVFEILGESIASLRVAWLGVAALATMSLLRVTRLRMERPSALIGSVSLIVLAFVIYPASMPTWWNLSLGLTAVALAYTGWQRGQAGYLLGAGILTGASILIKTTGGAFVAIAVFLWLLVSGEHRNRWYTRLAIGLALGVVVALVAPGLTTGRLLLLGAPAALVLLRLRHLSGTPVQDRVAGARTGNLPWWFACGVVTIPALAVAAFASIGGVNALVVGWLSSPALRFESAEGDIPVLPIVLLLLLMLIGIGSVAHRTGFNSAFLSVSLLGGLAVWALLDWADFGPMYFSVVAWSALLVAIAIVLLRSRLTVDPLTLLVTTTALLFSLIQIPLWNGFYASYTVPLIGLSVLISIPRGRLVAVSLVGVLAGLFLYQSVAGRLVGQITLNERVSYVELTPARAGIKVPVFHGYYNDLVDQVVEVAGTDPIYAGPDSPEVAFLAEVDSATPGFFEVLDADWDPQIVPDLARAGSAVVVNTRPGFSDPIPDDIISEIHDATDNRTTIGKFVLMWSVSDE